MSNEPGTAGLVQPRTAVDQATALRHAAVAATHAPSVHNTQPWRLAVGADWLELRGDLTRTLVLADPDGRQLHLSCGCAVLNACASLAAASVGARLELLPDPARPDLLARLTPAADAAPLAAAALAAAVETRQTPRGEFTSEAVDRTVVERLVARAAERGVTLMPVTDRAVRTRLAALDALARDHDGNDQQLQLELRRWRADEHTARRDGTAALSPVIPAAPTGVGDTVPDGQWTGLLVLVTPGDDRRFWLIAGMALEETLLQLTLHGYSAVPLMQIVEFAATRAELRSALGLAGHPQAVLRIGTAPRHPASRRRHLVDVIMS